MSAPPAATYTAGMPQLAPPYPDWKRWPISRHQTLRRRRPKPRRTISWPRPSTRPLRKIWDPAQNHNEGPGTSESLGPLLQGRISRISELSLRNIFSVSFWTLIQKNKRFGWLSPKTSGKLSALYCHLKFGNISHQKILRPHQHAVIIPLQKPMCEGQVLNAEDCRRLLFPNVWFIYLKKHHSLFWGNL